MAINYLLESNKYRPKDIGTLLVGEAPPPSGKTYFYVPKALSNSRPIETDTSLPATIFWHYFQERPTTASAYVNLLEQLQECGIFLIDICDEPIRVRGCPDGIDRIINDIPKLRDKVIKRNIQISDEAVIFLLARPDYKKYLKREFPNSSFIRWKQFRLTHE